jgi:hypothetical protein
MKHLKIAGLCLVSMLAASMAYSATASAANPVWEQCTETGTTTKYSENQCVKAEGGGNWAWQEIKGTEKVTNKGSLILKDTKTLVGTVEIECLIEGEGIVGPVKLGKIEKVKIEPKGCRAIKGCESIKSVEARDLPWQTEIFETEGKPSTNLTQDGNGEPGFKIACPVLKLEETDECLQEKALSGGLLTILSITRILLVRYAVPPTPNAKCSMGGEKSGEMEGFIGNATVSGLGLRVT